MNAIGAARPNRLAAASAVFTLCTCLGLSPWAVLAADGARAAPRALTAQAEAGVGSILDYFGRLQAMTIAELERERARLEERVSGTAGAADDLLRLALLRTYQGAATPQDRNTTAQLLQEYLSQPGLTAEQRSFTELMVLFAQEREVCQERLRQARHDVRALQRKLDALTTIETNLSHREGLQNPGTP